MKTELRRGLGALDGALLTIGGVIGTGIFLTPGDIARQLPHAGLILLVWVAGGALTLAGALNYAEMGAMFPRAGGLYHFLKEAYGPLWGFLYGWTAFFVIMSGGIAAISVGFGQYFGSFVPWFEGKPQVAGALAIVTLTVVHYFGLGLGVGVANVLTWLKIGAILGFVTLGFFTTAEAEADLFADLPTKTAVWSAFGIAMIGALWTYDGWYGLTFAAGEMRRPERSLPLGLISGCGAVTLLYLLLNLMYQRALPVGEMAGSARAGEDAAAALFGAGMARIFSSVILISILGCLSCTILYASRIYLPMAEDGVFFRAAARVHPRYATPGPSLWLQALWASALALSGTFEQLYTYAVFAGVLFHAATGVALFVLRRTRPDAPRPHRAWGYPLVPALFIFSCLLLVGNTLAERPVESLTGLGLVVAGVPAYYWWRRGR